MEAQAQRAEFWTDLASAARAVVSQPSVPLVSVAVMLFPGVLVLTPLHHSVALSVIDFASASAMQLVSSMRRRSSCPLPNSLSAVLSLIVFTSSHGPARKRSCDAKRTRR